MQSFTEKDTGYQARRCTICGRHHEDWPALAYATPTAYHNLTETERAFLVKRLSSDFCVIDYGDQTDRFIRTVLNLRVIDHSELLSYGLWVSLSERSFINYDDNFDNPDHQVEYFGWLASVPPEYDASVSVPMRVVTSTQGHRPEVIPFANFDHPFVRDYQTGITRQEAERRIHFMLDGLS